MSGWLKPVALVLTTCAINFAVMALFFGNDRAEGADVPSGNGDVNGDRLIDISDPVYLLSYIFGSGPEPVAIASSGLTPEQEEILSHLSIVYLDDGQGGQQKTIRVTGVNLQLVNGLGATNGNAADPNTLDPTATQTNGLGNLIVGYNEFDVFGTVLNDRSGSHNISVGMRNNFTSFGGLVAGRENTASAPYASVTGGFQNVASGDHACVAGGRENIASGNLASCSGGRENEASGELSSITGGRYHVASGSLSSITGGSHGLASGTRSSIAGGQFNSVSGYCASVLGGLSNEALGSHSVVSGGSQNTAGGGALASDETASSVSGGFQRSVTGQYDWQAGSLFEEQ